MPKEDADQKTKNSRKPKGNNISPQLKDWTPQTHTQANNHNQSTTVTYAFER